MDILPGSTMMFISVIGYTVLHVKALARGKRIKKRLYKPGTIETQKNMSNLKKCPFCQAEAKLHEMTFVGAYLVVCDGCNARSDVTMTTESATKLWNRRPE